jgi:hypothetical protein
LKLHWILIVIPPYNKNGRNDGTPADANQETPEVEMNAIRERMEANQKNIDTDNDKFEVL